MQEIGRRPRPFTPLRLPHPARFEPGWARRTRPVRVLTHGGFAPARAPGAAALTTRAASLFLLLKRSFPAPPAPTFAGPDIFLPGPALIPPGHAPPVAWRSGWLCRGRFPASFPRRVCAGHPGFLPHARGGPGPGRRPGGADADAHTGPGFAPQAPPNPVFPRRAALVFPFFPLVDRFP